MSIHNMFLWGNKAKTKYVFGSYYMKALFRIGRWRNYFIFSKHFTFRKKAKSLKKKNNFFLMILLQKAKKCLG